MTTTPVDPIPPTPLDGFTAGAHALMGHIGDILDHLEHQPDKAISTRLAFALQAADNELQRAIRDLEGTAPDPGSPGPSPSAPA